VTLNINLLVLAAPVLLFSVIAHEIAHGYAALKQGDPTALQLGRLTWNPLKHIDPWMTILLPALLIMLHGPILGGAKPVPVNPRNYRNFKRGDIIVSLAGVATNLLIALVSAALIAIFGLIGRVAPGLADPLGLLQAMASWSVLINIELLFFNLIPIPPLDGSHVVKYLLPPSWAVQYQRIGFFGIVIILLLLQTNLLYVWLTPGLYLYHTLVTNSQFFLPSAFPWLPPRI
jgi:Zn-dependent protease